MNQHQPTETNSTAPTALELAGVIPVDNLDQFVAYLSSWHADKVEQVKHFREIPEGSTFEVGDGPEATYIVLTGDALAGFKFGIEMALMQLGTLPFVAETEDETPDASAAVDAAG